jgi:hypothetical protein
LLQFALSLEKCDTSGKDRLPYGGGFARTLFGHGAPAPLLAEFEFMDIRFKKRSLAAGLFGLLAIGALATGIALSTGRGAAGALIHEEAPEGPGYAKEWRLLAWRDENGAIAPDGLQKAQEHIMRMSARSMKTRGSSGWQERGPTNVAGRTRSLLIDPRNPNKMFMGSVGGGIWISTDGGANWAPVDDRLPNLAISCMTFQPGNPDVIYAGTGEGYFNSDAISGGGILKSTDAGATWNILPSTTAMGNFNRISVSPTNPNIVLAAVQSNGGGATRGIFRSIDGGASWNQAYFAQSVHQVVFHPVDGNKAMATVDDYDFGLGVWNVRALYSTNGGANWTDSAGTRVNNGERIEVAYAPSNPNIVYAHSSVSGGKILRSTDGGQNFTLMTSTAMNEGQHWYDNMIWVDPTNSDFVVVGAVNIWKSTNGGSTVSAINVGGGPLSNTPHADVHFGTNDPNFNGTSNRTFYVGTDGGFYKTTDIYSASTAGGWTRFTTTARTGQFYGAVGHGGSGRILGGLQDNGTMKLESGSQLATSTAGGDGGWSAIDPTNSAVYYGEFQWLQIWRFDATGGWMINGGLGDSNTGNSNFIPPFILDPNNENRLLAGGVQLWRSNNCKATPSNLVSWASIKGSVSSPISAIAVAPGNSDIIWVGHNDGRIYKTVNGTSASPTWNAVDDNSGTNPLPARYIGRILIDPADSNKVYVAQGGFAANNLQRTLNGGTSFSSASGSGATALPAAPIRAISRHPSDANLLHVGTEVGICESGDGGATWSAPNKGPVNVSVDELNYMTGSTKLLAATHGRGIWTYGPLLVQSIVGPSNITAGNTAQVTLTLDGIAGGGGVNVALSSSNPALSTPSTVTVNEGDTQATFTVTANSVASSTPVTLTATLNGENDTTVITVNPGAASVLGSVSVTPNVVPGGSSKVVKFKVTLQNPAPAGGITVNLSSSNPSVAGMPSTVTIPVGVLTRTVTVSHGSVPTNTSVDLTATYNTDVLAASLMVEAPKPFRVVNLPNSVVGGMTTTVNSTVTLNAPAPAGGTLVTLDSSNTSAAVPSVASVTVPAGSTTANFTVNHFPVPALRNVNIKGTTNGVTKNGPLAVNPATLQMLGISPASVTGGGTTVVTGTVKINAPAPAAGARVTLTDDSATAVTPASVTIPAGATEATFNMTHSSVATNTVVTVTAVYNATKTDTLTLVPPALKTFALNRTSVVGGSATTVTGTLTLNAKAPAGGTVVTLSSSHPSTASVPASVTVPAGATTATFTVTHSPVVGSPVVVTLTAVGGGVTLTKTLTVNP